jgi:hypothetical protein
MSMKDTIFQSGIILGRITQLCVDRGVVSAGPEMGLADFLVLFSGELESVPLTEGTRTTITNEVNDLSVMLKTYPPNTALAPEDARIMIGLVSRWTDMMLDDFIQEAGVNPHAPGSEGNGSPFHEEEKLFDPEHSRYTGEKDPSRSK